MMKTPAMNELTVAREATYYRAPDALRGRIRAHLAAEKRAHAQSTWLRWGGMAASFALVSAVSWNAALMTARGFDGERVAQEVMTAHVRSLLVDGHLNDVISTDQHTVKPWFIGKLDFAPRVVDLASSGYTLIGGRLDYVSGRPVAALTYRHRLHVVNVFEMPAGDTRLLRPETTTLKGYSLVRWKKDGIEYWAIADVACADLLALADLLAKSSDLPVKS